MKRADKKVLSRIVGIIVCNARHEMKLSIFQSCLFLVLAMLGPCACQAALVFSNIIVTPNSLTFTVDGDLSGVSAPAQLDNQFSIRYLGDLWTGLPDFSPNTWSTSVFDNETLIVPGNTGIFASTVPYTWSIYASSLDDAVATNRTVTVSFQDDYLNPDATNGTIEFYWGNGNSAQSQTLLGSAIIAVPEPGSVYFVGLVCGLLCCRRVDCRKSVRQRS